MHRTARRGATGMTAIADGAAGPSPAAFDGVAADEAPLVATGRLARHTGWNLVGVVLPFAVGLLTIPVLTRELGPVRFGLLGLAWAMLEYLLIADAGLGRATVHFVARRLRAASSVDGEVVGAALLAQFALGAAAGALFALLTPWLVERVLDVPVALRPEGRDAFRVLALIVPFALLALALRGVLEAAERFDVAAALRVPSTAATFVVPAVAALLGATLPQIMLALLVVRIATCVLSWAAVRRYVPAVRPRWPVSWHPLRGLVVFGGWIALSNVLLPVFLVFDRLALGALVGAAAVGFYTAPYEAAARLLILPAALTGAVFPRVTALAGAGDQRALRSLFGSALRPLLATLVPLAIGGAVLAPELLTWWLGPEYAARSSTALRLLLVGVVANALAHVPLAFLQAIGRPDVGARFHVVELLVHVPATLLLVGRFGTSGAAAAWSLRALLDATLLFAASRRLVHVGLLAGFAGRWARYAALLGAVVVALLLARAALPLRFGVAIALAVLLAVGVAVVLVGWRYLLAGDDRASLRAAVRRG